MIWPFRRSQTPPDESQRHTVTLDLIEQVAYMRGQINAIEDDWKKVKEQVRKDYQRVEKANQRAERRVEGFDDADEDQTAAAARTEVPLHGFAAKIHRMRG